MRCSTTSIISSTTPGASKPFSSKRDSIAFTRKVGRDGGDVPECGGIKVSYFISAGSEQNICDQLRFASASALILIDAGRRDLGLCKGSIRMGPVRADRVDGPAESVRVPP